MSPALHHCYWSKHHGPNSDSQNEHQKFSNDNLDTICTQVTAPPPCKYKQNRFHCAPKLVILTAEPAYLQDLCNSHSLVDCTPHRLEHDLASPLLLQAVPSLCEPWQHQKTCLMKQSRLMRPNCPPEHQLRAERGHGRQKRKSFFSRHHCLHRLAEALSRAGVPTLSSTACATFAKPGLTSDKLYESANVVNKPMQRSASAE
jgi:hypothetical protein